MLERVGTASFQRTLTSSMKKAQGALADTQLQLATGKKATIYRDMGTTAMSSLSARSMLAREQAHSDVASGVKQTLDRYAHTMTHLYGSVDELYKSVGNIIAMGEARGYNTTLESTFGVVKQALNVNQGGEYIFAGGRSDTPPFQVGTLADLSALPDVNDAFFDEGLKAQARVSDGTDMVYGISAKEIGVKMADVLKSLHEMGPLDGKLTTVQLNEIRGIYGKLKEAMSSITDVQASNGQRQEQIDIYVDRAEARSIQLKGFVGEQEDADLAEITTKLVNDQLALQASYQAFSQIREMSLINFLR